MFTLLGKALPDLVGVIIAPGAIVAVVVFLATKNGLRKGWTLWGAGTVAAFLLTYVFHFLGDTSSSSSGSVPAWEGWFDLLAGLLFAYLLIPQLKAVRHPNPNGPKWLASVDKMSAIGLVGIGLYLGALNPKSIPLLMHVGMNAGAAKLPGTEMIIYAIIVAILANASMLVPVLIAQFSGAEGATILEALRTFMEKNSAIIMSVLFVVLAAVFISKGIEILVH